MQYRLKTGELFYEIKKYTWRKDAITGSSYVVQNPEEWKGKWNQCLQKNNRFI